MIPGMEGEPGGVFSRKERDVHFSVCTYKREAVLFRAGALLFVWNRAFQKTECGWREVAFVSDVSTDRAAVEQLARRCTEGQLDPIHLLDVVEDAL